MYTEDRIYHHRVEMIDGKEHYFVTFVDAHGDLVSVEVSQEENKALLEEQRNEAKIARSDRRHMEHESLSDREVDIRAVREHDTTEKSFIANENFEMLASVIKSLPRIQRRRFLLYRVEGLLLRDIAAIEGSSMVAIQHSIKLAEKKIRKLLGDYFDEG